MISPRAQYYWEQEPAQKVYGSWEQRIPAFEEYSEFSLASISPTLHFSGRTHLTTTPPLSPRTYHHHYEPPTFLAEYDDSPVEDSAEFWSASISVVDSLFDGSEEDDFVPPLSPKKQQFSSSVVIGSSLPESIKLTELGSSNLSKIFSYLSEADLARLQVSSKILASIATDNVLWKELYLARWKLTEIPQNGSEDGKDEWAWISSLLEQNDSWKEIYKNRHEAECWKIGTLKMFNGCWGFISQSVSSPLENNLMEEGEEPSDIFFHRKDIDPDGSWVEDWWLKDTAGVSRSQKCGYWDTFLCGRKVRYKQRAAYAKGRRPQACQISFIAGPMTSASIPMIVNEDGSVDVHGASIHHHPLPHHISGRMSYVSSVGASLGH